jgi:hypothetical protein
MEDCIDLVDDIWVLIFQSFDFADRAQFSLVSIRWKNIILSPYWKTLGYNIYGAHLTNGNSAVTRSISFLKAVKSHLSGLVDVNVSLLSDQSFNSVLDTFMHIKPLQRLRLL